MMGMDDVYKIVQCEACGGDMSRRQNRLFDVPQIAGDTVAGGCNFSYFDENLDTQITSRQHRKDVMKQKGLTEYNPDPEMKAHRTEARYIRERSQPNDPVAKAAIQNEYKTATDKRRNKLVRKSLDKSFKELGV